MKNILPVILRPEFHLYNSWIVPIIDKELDRTVYHIFCHKCGLYETYINCKGQNKVYVPYNISCPNCNNKHFFDIKYFEKNEIYKYINTKNICTETDYSYNCTAFLHKPTLIENEIENEFEIVYEMEFSKQNSNVSAFESNIFRKFSHTVKYKEKTIAISQLLLREILNKQSIDVFDLEECMENYNYSDDQKLEILQRYFKYLDINDFELLLVHNLKPSFKTLSKYLDYIGNYSNAKSIKKSIYQSFKYMTSSKEVTPEDILYDGTADFIICRVFSDVNIIVSLLKSHYFKKEVLVGFSKFKHVIKFLKWLFNFYTEKQVANLLLTSNRGVISDIFRLARSTSINNPHVFNKYFQKTVCNAQLLHNELVRISHIEQYVVKCNKKFKYKEKEIMMQVRVEDLVFKLPKDAKELNIWAGILNNCMSSYVTDIIETESLIFGVFRKRVLLYAIEVCDMEINQASGKSNSNIGSVDLSIIHKWMNNNSIMGFDFENDYEIEDLNGVNYAYLG